MAETSFFFIKDKRNYEVFAQGKVYRDHPAERMICELDWIEVYLITQDREVRLYPQDYAHLQNEVEEIAVNKLYGLAEIERNG